MPCFVSFSVSRFSFSSFVFLSLYLYVIFRCSIFPFYPSCQVITPCTFQFTVDKKWPPQHPSNDLYEHFIFKQTSLRDLQARSPGSPVLAVRRADLLQHCKFLQHNDEIGVTTTTPASKRSARRRFKHSFWFLFS